MNLLGAILRKSASPYAGTASGMFPGSSGYIDAFRSDPAPSAIELVRENLGTAYACGSLNAELVAKTRLRLYVRTGRGEGKSRLSKYGRTKAVKSHELERLEKSHGGQTSDAADIEEVTQHPALDLLARPNGDLQDGVGMSLFTLLEMTQLFLEVVGRAYWWLDRKGPGKTPSQLWILAPQYVTEWPGYGQDAKIIESYEFALGSGKAQYAPDDVVPFRMPDPATGGYTGGMSPLRAVFEQHRIIRQTDATTAARVKNGGKPDALFIPKGDEFGGSIGRDEASRLEFMLKRRYAMAGAGSIMVADIPGDLKPIAWPINDVVDAARLQVGEKKIAAGYRVPYSKLNRDVSNRASAESGDYAHAIDAGLPRLRRVEAALNTFLNPMYGAEAAARLFFAFDDPPGIENPETTQKRLELAAKRGMIQGNELRSMCGKRDVPQGEQFLADTGLVPLLPDGKPDPAYYRGANTDLASAEGDTANGAKAPSVPAQEATPEPPAKKPAKKKKPTPEAKAMLKMAKAVVEMAKAVERPIPNAVGAAVETPIPKAPPTQSAERPAVVTKSAGPHEYSCVMADLPNPHAADILHFVNAIPQDDLAEDGREDIPHVTALYGLTTDSPDDVKAVLSDQPPITLTLGRFAVFEPNGSHPGSDVVYVSVNSPDLQQLNAKLKTLDHKASDHAYIPHVTLAYVKPGVGQQYAGDERFAGRTIKIDRLTFSDKQGHKRIIRLSGDEVRQRLKAANYSDAEIDAHLNRRKTREHSEL